MASPEVWTFSSVLVISLLSLSGAATLAFGALRRHGTMMFLIALAAGTLIGDAFLHLLPEAAGFGFTSRLGMAIVFGFVLMFLLEVTLRWRHTHAEHIDPHHHPEDEIAPFGWINLIGDALHNILDGAIIAAAFLIDTSAGIATAIAVALHELPQELGDFAVLVRSGLSPAKALGWNAFSAFLALGGAAFVFLIDVPVAQLEAFGVPFIVGAFLYIAASDLVPELHHHSKGRDAVIILIGFLLGLALMAGLLQVEGWFEAGDGHDHG